METIKKWTERLNRDGDYPTSLTSYKGHQAREYARDAEIADLRAALAKQAEAAPVVARPSVYAPHGFVINGFGDSVPAGPDGEPIAQRAASVEAQEPYGWQQHINGVKTQNFARDEKELADIKMIFRTMKYPGTATYMPLYTAPPAPHVERDAALYFGVQDELAAMEAAKTLGMIGKPLNDSGAIGLAYAFLKLRLNKQGEKPAGDGQHPYHC